MMNTTPNTTTLPATPSSRVLLRTATVLGLGALIALGSGCETAGTRTSSNDRFNDRLTPTIGLDGGYETTFRTEHSAGHSARHDAGHDTGFSGGRQGAASDVVFASPRVQHYYIAISPEVLAELTRRDPDLSISDPTHVSAIENEWPVLARPDIDRERTGRTRPYSDNRFIYYELERD